MLRVSLLRTLTTRWIATIGWTAGVVAVVLTAVLCLANPGLSRFAAGGLLLGGVFWKRVPLAARLILVISAIAVMVAGCGASPGPPQFQWTAMYQVQINLSPRATYWTVSEQVTIPAESLRQITEGSGSYFTKLPPLKHNQYQLDTRKLQRVLNARSWILTGVINGKEPEFSLPRRSIPYRIAVVPLITTETIRLLPASLPNGAVITPSSGSSVIITAPAGVIDATTPASSAEATTTGEQRVIAEPYTYAGNSEEVTISTLSVLARAQPIRSLAGLSLAGGTSIAIGGVWTLLVALLQNALRRTEASTWRRLRRKSSAAPAPNATTHTEWSVADFCCLIGQGDVVPIAVMDLCSDRPGRWVPSNDIYARAHISAPSAAGQMASFARSMRAQFGRQSPPWVKSVRNIRGYKHFAYRVDAPTAAKWQAARAASAKPKSRQPSQPLPGLGTPGGPGQRSSGLPRVSGALNWRAKRGANMARH